MNVEEILERLISFNTINDKDNNEMINYIEQYLLNLEFKTELKNKNLIMSIGKKYKLGFQGHLDTVSVSKDWETDPFKLNKIANKLYGLGTCDMKGGMAAFLYAVSQVNFKELKYGLKLYFTYDEEIGFKGITDLVKAKIVFPQYMISTEPTDNVPMIGSKGLIEYEFDFDGVSTHSSIPIEGKNANKNAVIFLNKLLKLEVVLKKNTCNLYQIPYSTMNIGVINGGRAINIVPNNTKVLVDFRICQNDDTMKYIKKYIDDLVDSSSGVKYKILNEIKPFINESEIVNFYEEVTKNKRGVFFGVSEVSFIDSNRLILGPGPITAHQDNEYITLESLNKTAEEYLKIIKKICDADKKRV